VSTDHIRTATRALDSARPIVARLDAARSPDDIAADILEAWDSAEEALRALAGGSTARGKSLISDLRTNQLLSLEQGHAILGFLGARDRAARNDYRPGAADVQATREGFERIEAAVMDAGMASPVAAMGAGYAPPPFPGGRTSAPAAATVPTLDAPPLPPPRTGRRRMGVPLLPIALGLLVLALAGGGFWWWSQRAERDMRAGIAAYRAGRTDEARTHFTAVARNDPDDADPHIFLARMARDEGNLPGALSELQTAVRLEPGNGLALREMGAYLYTVGRYDLARNFFVRALQANPTDREAQGFLGCSLFKLGRPAEAQRFLQRAGQGAWSGCVRQMMDPGMAGQPGMLPQQPGVAGPYPQPQYPQPVR
jgi:tetratricopeptide (TPR) repeat protein